MARVAQENLVAAQPPPPAPDVVTIDKRTRTVAVAVFLAGSALAAIAFGIPDRPYVLLWVIFGAVVVCWRNASAPAKVLMDWLPVLVIAAGYDLVRSFAPDLVPRAVIEPQLRFDEIVFGGTAPTVTLQDALVDRDSPHWWDYVVWGYYLSHFVVTPLIALWLYLRHREWFHRYAWLILIVTLAGFVTYFAVPAVPPWMASREGELQPTVRIVHAVWEQLGFGSAAQVFAGDATLANPVAALPSLHAAWPFLALTFLWNREPRSRVPLGIYNVLMVFVLVYGSEHYVSDILLGWLYVAVVYVVVNRFLDRRARRRGRPMALDGALRG